MGLGFNTLTCSPTDCGSSVLYSMSGDPRTTKTLLQSRLLDPALGGSRKEPFS
jgi:hypothetical protein